jgi:hypothetical protein
VTPLSASDRSGGGSHFVGNATNTTRVNYLARKREGRCGDRPVRNPAAYYSQWCDPFFEDDGGTFLAVVVIFIILGGLIIYGSAHLV